jgi:hypothetical protein
LVEKLWKKLQMMKVRIRLVKKLRKITNDEREYLFGGET